MSCSKLLFFAPMELARKIPPPVYLMVTLLVMTGLNFRLPILRFITPPYSYAGSVLVVIGTLMTGYAARLFAQAGTPLLPFERSTALVTRGPYRFTRNPMYVGLVLILLGVAILQGSLGAFLPIPLFIWIIRTSFILGEERFLENLFGNQYLDYKRSVRRWI
jgi:protein-S-isoprenylcysteine O-methyltransferase Ste14